MIQKEARKKTRAHIASAALLSIMIVSLVCVIGSVSVASGSPDANGSLSMKETDPNGYVASLAAKLKTSFFTTLSNGTMVLVYPLEYGGAYIDHSNNLHIVLSKYATNTTIDIYRSIIGDPDVIFEYAEFPLSYLYEIQDSIIDAHFRFDTAGVNEITNRLEIHLPTSTKPEDVLEYFKNKFADFDERCVTLLGPNPISAGVGELNSPMVTPDSYVGFLGTEIPAIYGAAAVAVIAVTVAVACFLAFVRRGVKPQANSD